jgi:hypothetical protein
MRTRDKLQASTEERNTLIQISEKNEENYTKNITSKNYITQEH